MLYTAQNLHLPHVLFYSWTGWPHEDTSFSGDLSDSARAALFAAWKSDGFAVQSFLIEPHQAKLTCAARPDASPVHYATRAKGRLQHALRQAGSSSRFSRKTAARALGNNLTGTVVRYVRDQLKHVDLADPRYRERLRLNAHDDVSVDLSQPAEMNRSRYWYNLHLVFITAARYRMGGEQFLATMRERFLATGESLSCRIRALALMPDHVHLVVRAHPEMSPGEIGLQFQNETAAVAMCKWWQDEFYVGTFSEYDLNAIRD